MSIALTIALGAAALFGIWRLSKAMDRRNAKSVRESDEMWAKALEGLKGDAQVEIEKGKRRE